MSTAVDLGELGLGGGQYVPDQGYGQTGLPNVLTLPGIIFQQDQGYGQIAFPTNDLGSSLNTVTTTNQDQGFAGTALQNTLVLSGAAKQVQEPQPTSFYMSGYDTVAATVITWTGSTPLAQPPTQHTVINVSSTLLNPFVPVVPDPTFLQAIPINPLQALRGDLGVTQSPPGTITLWADQSGNNINESASVGNIRGRDPVLTGVGGSRG